MQQLLLEKTSEIQQYPKNYPEGLDTNSQHAIVEHAPVFVYEHTNTYVSPYGLAFKNWKLIPESIYFVVKDSVNSYTFYKKILFGKVIYLDKDCVLFHHAWYDNYYHWFTECYPKLILAKELIKDKILIINENLKPFHKQSLEVIDCAGIHYIKNDELIKASKLYIIGQLSNKFGVHHPIVISKLSSFLKEAFKIETEIIGIKNIYTSRARSSKRKCNNEIELLSMLSNYGFEEVITDDLSLKEQFLLFSRTANVCGVHGSSFVNSLFMSEGGMVIDLIERNHNDLCYFNLTKNIGLDYLYFPCDGAGASNNYRDNDIFVDLKTLQKRLEMYL